MSKNLIGMDIGREPPTAYSTNKTKLLPVIGSDPSLIYGVELEIEAMGNIDQQQSAVVPGMVWHEDGSLRNNGAEYVTKPMMMRELAYVLDQFFKKNKLTEANYSERCSVHVHTNVTDLSWEQLKTLVLTYLVFERCLFSFIGNERDKNIFCVPLYDTKLASNLLKVRADNSAFTRFSRWEKYTALNFLPIGTQGSIEWRHMAGTNDLDYILLWCNIIGKVYNYARNRSWDQAVKFFSTLNTSSMYNDAVLQVFGELAPVVFNVPSFAGHIEEGVLNAKYALGEFKQSRARKNEYIGFIIDDVVVRVEENQDNEPAQPVTWLTTIDERPLQVTPEVCYNIHNVLHNTHQATINTLLERFPNHRSVIWWTRNQRPMRAPRVSGNDARHVETTMWFAEQVGYARIHEGNIYYAFVGVVS